MNEMFIFQHQSGGRITVITASTPSVGCGALATNDECAQRPASSPPSTSNTTHDIIITTAAVKAAAKELHAFTKEGVSRLIGKVNCFVRLSTTGIMTIATFSQSV